MSKRITKMILIFYFFTVSDMLGNIVSVSSEEESVSDIKQEYEEDDHLEIVDNLKQEEPTTDTFPQHIKNEDENVKYHMSENFVNHFDGAESTITDIK